MKAMRRIAVLALALIMSGTPALLAKGSDGCNVVFIGDSITEGALHADSGRTAPPVVAAELLEKKLGEQVLMYNCGRSGATTVDFLPSYVYDFSRVKSAIEDIRVRNGNLTVFSIMLGTNDSASTATTGAPVSGEDYAKNLRTIIGSVRELCPNSIFVLHRPIWYSPNTYNGAMYLVAGQKRLAGYTDELERVAAEIEGVYMGDREAFGFFREKYGKYHIPENGNAGVFYLHPNEKGAAHLARFWAKAIAAAVETHRATR